MAYTTFICMFNLKKYEHCLQQVAIGVYNIHVHAESGLNLHCWLKLETYAALLRKQKLSKKQHYQLTFGVCDVLQLTVLEKDGWDRGITCHKKTTIICPRSRVQ